MREARAERDMERAAETDGGRMISMQNSCRGVPLPDSVHGYAASLRFGDARHLIRGVTLADHSRTCTTATSASELSLYLPGTL